MRIYEANEKYFDFDFAEAIAQAIIGGMSPEQGAFMLQQFDKLSEVGKNAVGKEDFDFDYRNNNVHGISEADWDIICSVSCEGR